MQRVLRLCFAVGLLLLAAFDLQAQSGDASAKAQEDFALAVATAHARTSLFGAGSAPFVIHATAISSLGLHGIGKGTYENRWVDAHHWHRVIQFPDFKQTEMRNDSGHYWTDGVSRAMPIRVAELLRFVVIHVPSSNAVSALTVTETSVVGDKGESLTCYSATPPTPPDGFQRRVRFCFDTASGLLVSQDFPLNMHIVYSNYIVFQGKHEFTHVHVTSGGLTSLDVEIQYAPLDSHALDGAVPDDSMHRSASAESTPNPEELGKGTVEYRYNPIVPSGTSEADKKKPVQMQFYVSADNVVVDASVEDAPTQAMAEAALESARKFTFTPLTLDGKPVANRFYYSVWFRASADDTSTPGDVADKQPKSADTPRATAPSGSEVGGVYRNKELALAFHYPAGFDEIPRGQLEDERRSGRARYGFELGSECNTLLFRVQQLHPGERSPETVSITDLAPTCIFGVLDRNALGIIAANGARSITDQWGNGSASKPKQYTVNGRTFAIVSASGTAHRTVAEHLNLLVVVTTIHDHVIGWTLLGPDANHLARTLAACTQQIGEGREGPLYEKP